ncbi:4-hydroxyacetophenone monooxygenase [Ventosimonas gracilis]|uniref:4-hydroxyacetophenone monooxygenase n=2 Tax=Ventosimonas gracilis TaxID=1680762 RepID=A0A139SQS5_9GAMM|nr:4-hydroxyacetophenone monooxygenase [Ventosimonas gracilis]
MMNVTHSKVLKILIIGAGFAGLGLAVRLLQSGQRDWLILEQGEDIGGTWRVNHYPGAACDVPSHLYSFSFAPNPDWSYKFARQEEIFAYQQHLVQQYSLRPHIRFNCAVESAEFDEENGLWRVRNSEGELFFAKVLVTASGQLSLPKLPDLEGLEDFAGAAFHTACWRRDVTLKGKRVAVIGSGASAVQLVPQIAPQVAKLALFQRSAPYVLPKPDRRYRPWEQALWRHVPFSQTLARWLQYVEHEARVPAFSHLPALMKVPQWQFRRYLARQVQSTELRQKLTPNYPMGCKRILLANDYYPALQRDNVEVIDTPIKQVCREGIQTQEGQLFAADALIFATGFAATDFLAPMRIVGRAGALLSERWKDSAQAYLGLTVHGFPNLFTLLGPNTALGHSSMLYMMESQYNYLLGALKHMQQQGLQTLEVKAQPMQVFSQKLAQRLRGTVWGQGCHSWYKTEDGTNPTIWPGFTFSYRWLTRRFNPNDCVFTTLSH